MDDGGNLWIAVVGGAIGTSLTGLFLAGARVLAAWREVTAHERAVRERDEDLEQWVVDETVRLKRALLQKVNELNARNLFFSGAMHAQANFLKETALQAYRDQERQARRDVAAIRDREGWLHLMFRAWRRRPALELRAPERVQPVLDAWRAPFTRHQQPSDEPVPVDDPTRRTLDELHAKLVDLRKELT